LNVASSSVKAFPRYRPKYHTSAVFYPKVAVAAVAVAVAAVVEEARYWRLYN